MSVSIAIRSPGPWFRERDRNPSPRWPRLGHRQYSPCPDGRASKDDCAGGGGQQQHASSPPSPSRRWCRRAFILIGSKVGDLIGRKRAYVLGLLGYAVGAIAMALAQSLTAVIIFRAFVGGLGASLLLPSMQIGRASCRERV